MTGRRRRVPRRQVRPPAGRIALILALFFFAMAVGRGFAGAVEWSVTPSLNLRGEVNDNILMTPGEQKLVVARSFSPMLRFGAATERWSLQADFAATLARYLGEEELNSDDPSLRVASQYQWERSRWSLNGSLVRDSTWQSELRQTGLTLAARRREARTIDGFWEESLTERFSVQGRYQWTDVVYANEGSGLFDYLNQVGSLDLNDALSERDRATAGVYLLDYRAPSARLRSIEWGLRAGWTHSFSETLSATASIGGRWVITQRSFPDTGIKDHGRGLLGNVEILKELASERWRGGLSRQVDPSGSGSLIQVDHLFALVEREATERTTISLAADGYHSRVLQTGPSVQSNAYRITPAWLWKVTENWSMSVSYRYAWQKEKGGPGAASNALIWTLNYQGSKWVGPIESLSEGPPSGTPDSF